MHNEWSDELAQELLAPFSLAEEEYLPRGGKRDRDDKASKPTIGLVYLGAESVIARLNATVGPHGWSFTVDPVPSAHGIALYGRLTVLGAVHEDFGEANGESELLKSARTDCLKRCARNVGLGLYLWFFPKDNWGKHDGFKWTEFPQVEPRLRLQALRLAGWKGALPGGEASEPRSASRPNPGPARAEQAMRSNERDTGLPVAGSGPGAAPPTPSLGALDPQEQRKSIWTTGGDQGSSGARQDQERPAASDTALLACSNAACGKPLTRGQHDVSLRAFNKALCPQCQRTQKAAA